MFMYKQKFLLPLKYDILKEEKRNAIILMSTVLCLHLHLRLMHLIFINITGLK